MAEDCTALVPRRSTHRGIPTRVSPIPPPTSQMALAVTLHNDRRSPGCACRATGTNRSKRPLVTSAGPRANRTRMATEAV